jgi:acyl-CoA thioesterase YciA
MNDAESPAAAAPQGELSIRTLAKPSDTNQNGDIFGGWLLGQMDIAGNIFAYKIAKGRAVTVAVDGMVFHKPVYVGDVVSVYSNLIKVGRTSISVHVEAWVMRRNEDNLLHVTDGNFTYVAIDDSNHPRPIKA